MINTTACNIDNLLRNHCSRAEIERELTSLLNEAGKGGGAVCVSQPVIYLAASDVA